jgi:hypothetical protein
MEFNLDEIICQIDQNTLTILNSLPPDGDFFKIVDIISAVPNSAIVVKGANNWHLEWVSKFKSSMIEFICSDNKDTLSSLLKSNGVNSKILIAVCSTYVASRCGLEAAAISAIVGAILVQVVKRGRDSFCSVIYAKENRSKI